MCYEQKQNLRLESYLNDTSKDINEAKGFELIKLQKPFSSKKFLFIKIEYHFNLNNLRFLTDLDSHRHLMGILSEKQLTRLINSLKHYTRITLTSYWNSVNNYKDIL